MAVRATLVRPPPASKPEATPKPEPTPKPPRPAPNRQPQELTDGTPDPDARERCLDEYEKCIESGKGSKPGRVKGETLCASCMAYCKAHGFWPDALYTWGEKAKPCK